MLRMSQLETRFVCHCSIDFDGGTKTQVLAGFLEQNKGFRVRHCVFSNCFINVGGYG